MSIRENENEIPALAAATRMTNALVSAGLLRSSSMLFAHERSSAKKLEGSALKHRTYQRKMLRASLGPRPGEFAVRI